MSDLQVREFRNDLHRKEWELQSFLLKVELTRIQNEQGINEIRMDLWRGNNER